MRRYQLAALISSVLTFVAACLLFMALHDIAKGTEPDLSGEWMVVDYAWLTIMITVMTAVVCGALGLRKRN